MADSTENTGFVDPSANNAAVAATLAAQDINTKSSVSSSEDQRGTFAALDELAKAKSEENAKNAEEAPVVTPKAGETPATADPAPAPKPDSTPVVVPEATPETIAAKKVSDELFKDVQLPTNRSPKSAEAFATVKERAAREIENRDRALIDLQAQLKDAEAKLQNPVPEEIEKELKELREWRAKLDVDADPKFKEFDQKVAGTEDFIYAQLRKSPVVTDEIIADIKKYGGPANVNLNKLWAAVNDPTLQRIVESRIAEIEQVKFTKEEAIKATKANVSEYVANRAKEFETSKSAHNSETEKCLAEVTGKLTWLRPVVADPKAADKAKAEADAADHNKFVAEVKGQLDAASKDDSPQMRAILLAGMAQLLQYQRSYEVKKTALAVAEKQVAELTAKLDRFKGASASRIRESAAAPGGKPTEKPASESDIFHTDTKSALNNIAKQIMEEKARAASNG